MGWPRCCRRCWHAGKGPGLRTAGSCWTGIQRFFRHNKAAAPTYGSRVTPDPWGGRARSLSRGAGLQPRAAASPCHAGRRRAAPRPADGRSGARATPAGAVVVWRCHMAPMRLTTRAQPGGWDSFEPYLRARRGPRVLATGLRPGVGCDPGWSSYPPSIDPFSANVPGPRDQVAFARFWYMRASSQARLAMVSPCSGAATPPRPG